MEIAQITGYLGALVIGIVLGLIGGGGSILTVPILVYILHINPITATAYSLFVVGVSASVGALKNVQKGLVDFKTAIVFSIPAFITVYCTRKFLIPALPNVLFSISDFLITKEIGIMILFGTIMLLAAFAMIKVRSKNCEDTQSIITYNYPLIIIEGILVGVLTGIVGAGGGFLIIPALVILAKLPMKKAIATSLFIIAIKSLIGFIGDIQNQILDWNFLVIFTTIAVVGIFIGLRISTYIEGNKLKKIFGWFVLIMALYIIYKESSSYVT